MVENSNLSWYKKHKDAKPKDTIKKIRNILTDIDILPVEKGINMVFDDFYTVRIITDFGDFVGQNGKGISVEYALASGYSEFIERLQNLFLIKKEFGLMSEIKIKRQGSTVKNIKDVIKENEQFFEYITNNNILKIEETLKQEYVECIPYFNVNKNKVCFLPEFLFSFTSSNGMCAGNTPEEAISQGICEIFERYSIRYIYENKIDVPTIPFDQLKNLVFMRE